ncbi:unnamed protein product [Ilex paraguariensis]|uniref:LOB domain-containing protein n=1 Tax=Ilex paraguariensis TaxID=185542 RepID=A0ABC8TVJ4_9AQUA
MGKKTTGPCRSRTCDLRYEQNVHNGSRAPSNLFSCSLQVLEEEALSKLSIHTIFSPPTSLKTLANVHKVFGPSNVRKILNDVPVEQVAVNSMVYGAEVRPRYPVHWCAIASLQTKIIELQHDLLVARAGLAHYTAKPATFMDDHLSTAPFFDLPVRIDSFTRILWDGTNSLNTKDVFI